MEKKLWKERILLFLRNLNLESYWKGFKKIFLLVFQRPKLELTKDKVCPFSIVLQCSAIKINMNCRSGMKWLSSTTSIWQITSELLYLFIRIHPSKFLYGDPEVGKTGFKNTFSEYFHFRITMEYISVPLSIFRVKR